jgi:hypothetical protein
MKYKISFVIELPDDIAFEQVEEWARYSCHDNGSMSIENELIEKFYFEPIYGTFEIKGVSNG